MGRASGHLTALLATVLAVLLVGGALAAFAIGRTDTVAGRASGGSGTASGSAPQQPTGQEDPSASADSDTSNVSGTGSTSGRDSGERSESGVTGPPTSPSKPGQQTHDDTLTVTLSPSAEGSPQAQAIADLLERYFGAINRHDYDAWLTTVTTAQSRRDRDSWTTDYSTTRDSDVYVSDITPGKPLTVRMQFVSHQAVSFAPAELPLTCIRWDVTYKIIDEGIGLRVGTSTKAPAMVAC